MRLAALLLGQVRTFGEPGAESARERGWTSATVKTPVEDARWVRRLGVEGDAQADLVHHGGVDKAVLACAAAHVPFWREQLERRELGAGAFGENFFVEGQSEETVCVGDVLAVGEARVQVCQPRKPCWKQARRWDVPDLVVQMESTGFTGWYLRVLEEGRVRAGDAIALLERPHPEWSIARAHRARADRATPAEALRALIALPELAEAWKQPLRARLDP